LDGSVKKMKALLWLGPDKLAVREVAKPVARREEALIRVISNGICGTDITIVKGFHPRAKPPLIPGHEILGEVEAISSKGGKLEVGDRVAVRPIVSCGKCAACKSGYPHVCRNLTLPGIDFDGGCAEYVRLPVSLLHRVPEKAAADEVALTEPLAVAVHALERIRPLGREDKILIFGAGPIGALLAMLLYHRGFRKFVVADISSFRLARLKGFGFDVLNASDPEFKSKCFSYAGPDGFEVILEATGSKEAALWMTELLGVRGRVLALGVHKAPHAVDLTQVAFKELEIIGTRVYTTRDFENALRLAATNRLGLARLITHRFKIDDAADAFKAMEDTSSSIKVLIDLT